MGRRKTARLARMIARADVARKNKKTLRKQLRYVTRGEDAGAAATAGGAKHGLCAYQRPDTGTATL